jgi:hypothetical protein
MLLPKVIIGFKGELQTLQAELIIMYSYQYELLTNSLCHLIEISQQAFQEGLKHNQTGNWAYGKHYMFNKTTEEVGRPFSDLLESEGSRFCI